MPDRKLLGIYLNDHLAGATAVVELVRRAAGEYEGTELGAFLAGLRADVEADRAALRDVMAANGTHADPLKEVLGWVAEKVGRLKLNGRLLSRSPLTPVVELEAIAIGVHGKLLLWRALRDAVGAPALGLPAGIGLDELIVRAEAQLAALEGHRVAAARQAVGA